MDPFTIGLIVELGFMIAYNLGDSIVKRLNNDRSPAAITAAISEIERGALNLAYDKRNKILTKLNQITSDSNRNALPSNVQQAFNKVKKKLEKMDTSLRDDIASAENAIIRSKELAQKSGDIAGIYRKKKGEVKEEATSIAKNAIDTLNRSLDKVDQEIN